MSRLDERTIIPANSDCLEITQEDDRVRVRYERDEFVFPAADVAMLAIAHSSAEELARFLWHELCGALRACDTLAEVIALEISVAEGPGQTAHYRGAVKP